MSNIGHLSSLHEYVFPTGRDAAMRWTEAGYDGLVVKTIPSWIKNCRRRYEEDRKHLEVVDVGGEG